MLGRIIALCVLEQDGSIWHWELIDLQTKNVHCACEAVVRAMEGTRARHGRATLRSPTERARWALGLAW